MTRPGKKTAFFLIVSPLALLFLWQIFYNDSGYSDGDSITHYLMARFAFKHPLLFLDHWGKPAFTLAAAPFALFGFKAIQCFNLLCAVLAAWFAFRSAEKLGIQYSPAIAIFIFMAPVFYSNLAGGLTEFFFALLLIAGIYLVLDFRNQLAAMVISFLPLCRTEGFLLLPLFLLFFLMEKNWRCVILSFTGILLYSLIGYFVFDDIAWLLTQNPYRGNQQYGSSPLLYFVHENKYIFGYPLGILFLSMLFVGTFLFLRLIRQGNIERRHRVETLLILGGLIVYFAAHSYFWYKGSFSSIGMTRVMAAVVPLFALGCLRGFSLYANELRKIHPALGFPALCLVALLVIYEPLRLFGIRQELDPRNKTIKEGCNYLKTLKAAPSQVFYSHPFTVISMDIDPYESEQKHELMWVPQDRLAEIAGKGNYIVWDSQFGPVESHTPLELLADTTRFELLKRLQPASPVTVLANQPFEVRIYRVK